jgi:hypothetical protein
LITSRIKSTTQNLPKAIEELEAYEVEIASERQKHDLRYARVETGSEVHQAGIMFTDLLPELPGQCL